MFCRNCGMEINDKAEFCIACGCRPISDNKYCQECGVATNAAQEMCINCGSKLNFTSQTVKPQDKTVITTNKVLYFIFTGLGILGVLLIIGNIILPDDYRDSSNLVNAIVGGFMLIVSIIVRKITRNNFSNMK